MAGKLKEFFDGALVRSIARQLRGAHASFDERGFVRVCLDGLEELELIARGAHIAEAMHRYLPRDFETAADILIRSLGPELERTEGFGMAPFRYLPHTTYVARHGLDHFEAAMRAQYELTKRFSAEGSIRAYLMKYPRETYARLMQWAQDPNVHVRRLVSEGTRPRLPWAPRLRTFQEDPRPVVRLLELLKDDPERYVQRSVANSVNDIGKDHPEIAIEVCRRWALDAPPGRQWVVKHALRSLVKRGDRGALKVLGAAAVPRVGLHAIRFEPVRVALGGILRVSFDMVSEARKDQELVVDFAVHFVKANGERRAKVFKLRRLVLPARGQTRLEAKVSFADMTTRTHYPGIHAVDALVNGQPFPLGQFEVYTARRGRRPAPG